MLGGYHDEEEHNHDHKEHKHSHSHDHHDHEHSTKIAGFNINVESAFLHVLGDMLMSVGVIIAAIVVYINPAFTIADPICTYLFSVIICFTTIPVFKDCIKVMMEGTPEHVDVEKLMEDIFAIEGVEEIHDFHLWSISVGKFALSAHIQSDKPLKTLSQVTDLCRRKYNLFHTTIQMEGYTDQKHAFICENDIHD